MKEEAEDRVWKVRLNKKEQTSSAKGTQPALGGLWHGSAADGQEQNPANHPNEQETDSPLGPPEGMQPCQHSDFVRWDQYWILIYRIIK